MTSSLTVYCGSRPGASPEYLECARALGQRAAEEGYRIVYGGGSVGLMGALADAALAAGGDVLGVIPTFLRSLELAHEGVTELVEVVDMQERKRRMIEEGDAFLILPGGTGTLEELFEVLSWRQLALHRKPVLALDLLGYWDPLRRLLDHICGEGFTSPPQRELLEFMPTVEAVFERLALA